MVMVMLSFGELIIMSFLFGWVISLMNMLYLSLLFVYLFV